jgi:nucleotide-binding universal stress UspA family protein
MQNILVPYDYSENAGEAVKYAIQVSEKYNTKVHILYVFDAPPMVRLVSEQAATELAKDINPQKLQKHIEENILTTNLFKNIEYSVKFGNPSSMIVETCKELSPILVVMGMKGNSSWTYLTFGSVTMRMIDTLNIPVLVIPPGVEYNDIKRIGFGTDFNIEDFFVINNLINFATVMKAKLYCFHVKASDTGWHSPTIRYMKDKYKDSIDSGVLQIDMINNLSVSEGIAKYIDENKIDMMAILKEKHTIISRIFDKSYTKSLTLSSNIPVMIFREED